MKAVRIMRFGGPEVVQIADVDRPAVGQGGVLVAVEATSVNALDVKVRAGELKFVSGRRFPIGIGLDFSGVIAAVGPGVDGCEPDDRVWGTVSPRTRHSIGAAAEYVSVAADHVGPAPANLTATEAASLVVAGCTALQALRDFLRVTTGDRVLIRGAAGGVGTAAVQLAHAMGCHVTALARESHAKALIDLGADEVHDYSVTSARQLGPFDGILDTAGTDLGAFRHRLTAGGRMVTVALSSTSLPAIAFSTVYGSRRIRTFSGDPHRDLLDAVSNYVTAGALRPVVAGTYPLGEITAAHQAFERGGACGKQVVEVSS